MKINIRNDMRSMQFILLGLLALLYTKGSHGSEQAKNTIIGIDLGTTYSCVAIMNGNGKVEIIPNDQGNRITPSYLAFTEEGERLIGDSAKNQLTSNPKNTVFDAKRLIGREWSDKTVQNDIKYFPFTLQNKNNKPHIKVETASGEKVLTPEEVSAAVLSKMKSIAEDYLGYEVTDAVVTVPAYFNDAQRAATKDAGIIAGLNIKRIINEPTAAALSYGLESKGKQEQNVLVFDLGGGTFDVSVLALDNGVFEVLATNGDTHLGGEDFDQNVMDHFIKLIKKKTGKDIRSDIRAIQKLRREVEKAKRALSSSHQTKLEVEALFDGQDFSETLTRAKFEELNMDLFRSTINPVKKVLQDSDLKVSDIDEVILVGGSTRIPKIQQLIKEYFKGKEPARGVNPDEAVAYGAAVQACILSGANCGANDILLIDVNALSVGIETVGGVLSKLITRNTAIPTKKSQVFSTSSDNQQTVKIAIYEGERPMTKDNHLLGSFDLTGIPPAPRGVAQIEVTFEMDSNGILQVSAKDKGTNNENSITITNDQNRLTPDEIDKMIKDAEVFAEEDRLLKEKTEAKNKLENYAYSLKRQIDDKEQLGGKINEEDKEKIQTIVDEKLEWLNDHEEATTEEFNAVQKEIEEVANPIIAKLYGNTPPAEDEEDNTGHGDEL